MPIMRHGTASWPGAIAIEACQYTISHGISPGTAVLRMQPQAAPPNMFGDLVIGDGVEAVTLRDCKIESINTFADERGFYWSVQISDRRWKWRDLGEISGAYNQLDPHAKLIPWTIRSPREMVELCLRAMGETRFRIDMPVGLTRAQGQAHAVVNPPWIGVVPVVGTNSPQNWEVETPAVTLANLCETYGRRVIYRWSDDSVLIAVPGKGDRLPDNLPIARDSPVLKTPQMPAGVKVVGSPTVYQVRLLLEAVGEEWDGSYRLLNELSYRPAERGQKQLSEFNLATSAANVFRLYLGGDPDGPPSGGVLFTATSAIASTAVSTLAAAINASADPRIARKMKAGAAGAKLTVEGLENGVPLNASISVETPVAGTASATHTIVTPPIPDDNLWAQSGPPVFPQVQATSRLRRQDAMALAQRSVFRMYRIAGVDASGEGPIEIPVVGRLQRRQQIVLTNSQVEQVRPQPLDEKLIDPKTGEPFLENFYNGYSRDKPAVCFGSMTKIKAPGVLQAWFLTDDPFPHTADADQIYVPFRINAEEQIVEFSAPVYRFNSKGVEPSRVILQTGVMVRHAETNALYRYSRAKRFPNGRGDANFAVRTYQDIQLNVVARYDAKNKLTGAAVIGSDAEVFQRSKYYLDGLAAQYITEEAQQKEYIHIVPLDLDGAISQITWIVGEEGATTIASRNSEHSIYVPPYPVRRRAEFLPPAAQQQIQQAARPPRVNLMSPDNPFLKNAAR